tara:strand:- start:188 stop:754 length:567 start_codon:yes stop_codon:yes gene_type:complete
MIYDLENLVNKLHQTPSDINEHFPAIIKYGSECDHITEMGVRGIMSTWGWLACSPKKLISYDIRPPKDWNGDLDSVYDTAKAYGIPFEFKLKDVLKIEIEETDLLFLDTYHVYSQLKEELRLHSNKARKYICFHDTTSYEVNGEDRKKGTGIWKAVEEFLEDNKDKWVLQERFTNNNGFTIIKRINND